MYHCARGVLCLDIMTPQWNRSATLYVAMTCVVAVLLSERCGRNVETLRHFLGSPPISMAGHLVGMSHDRAVKKVFLWKPEEQEDQNRGG